jgi:hypothetical protein
MKSAAEMYKERIRECAHQSGKPEVTVCAGSDHEERVATMLLDLLIRLVMISDAVTEQAMIAVFRAAPPIPGGAPSQRHQCTVAQTVHSRLLERRVRSAGGAPSLKPVAME